MSIIVVSQSFAITTNDLLAMRKNYQIWSNGIPCGDINESNIGNSDQTQRLIYSESVSYALLSHVLSVKGENEAESKAFFDKYREFAKQKMLRSNEQEVYNWDCSDTFQQWIPLPEKMKDSLLSWRYVENIENTDRGGIIIQTENESTHCHTPGIFQDGSQVATDGDLLIAYALLLAYDRWHDVSYLDDAKALIYALREKAIYNFKSGEIIDFSNQGVVNKMFYGTFDDMNANGKIIVNNEQNNVMIWEGINNYVGFWHEPTLDLLNLDEIILSISGHTSGYAGVFFEIEDNSGEDENPGHIYITKQPVSLSASNNSVHLSKDDFIINPDYGKSGALDWSSIKNLSLKVQTQVPEYYPFYGEFGGSIQLNDYPSHYEWTGSMCYFGFDLIESRDYSKLTAIKMKISGTGYLELQLLSANNSNKKCQVNLTENSSEIVLNQNNFSGGDLQEIKKINFNGVNSIHAMLDYMLIEFSDGTSVRIAPSPAGPDYATVELQSIHIKLNSGQTSENDGCYLLSNAHGAPYINPSYFMPFAYKKFMEIDTTGAEKWKALLDNTYAVLEKSLHLTLHDMNQQEVVGNGQLFPNWFQLDPLSGRYVDISTQKSNNTVRGYIYGYDAFRTIAFLCMDYYYDKDIRAYELLRKIYPFFAESLNQHNKIFPTYKIDGTADNTDDYQYTSFGFYAVYLNLFNIMHDQNHIDQLLFMLENEHFQTDGDRGWVKSDNPLYPSGKTEYFMNFWTFFGNYFFDLHYDGPWSLQTVHFNPVWENAPYSRMKIWLKGVECLDLEPDDEIGIFDGNLCVGAGRVEKPVSKENPLIITCSKNDNDNSGFTNGNPILFRIWNHNNNNEISSEFIAPLFSTISDDTPFNETKTFQSLEDYQVVLKVGHTIQVTADSGGKISPAENILVSCHGNQSFKIIPDEHFYIDDVLIDGQSIGPVNEYTFQNMDETHSIMAKFGGVTYTIIFETEGNGTVIPPHIWVQSGSNIDLSKIDISILPGSCSKFSRWEGEVDGLSNVSKNLYIKAVFVPIEYRVTLEKGDGIILAENFYYSTIDPKSIDVECGQKACFGIFPKEGFHVENVIINNIAMPLQDNYICYEGYCFPKYCIDNIQQRMTISATYQNDPPDISPIDDQSITVNRMITIDFTVSDKEITDWELMPDDLVIEASSSNPSLIPNESIIIGGAEENRQLTISTLMDQTGTSEINITVTDKAGLSVSETFIVTVNLVEQTIPLTQGWNLFSPYLKPVNQSFEDIIQPLIENKALVKVIGTNKETMIVNNEWQHGLKQIDFRQGYYINVNKDISLTITGIPPTLPVSIDLLPGWNLIGYPCMYAQSIENIITPLIDSGHYIKMIDQRGIHDNNLSEIELFTPGKGYWIKIQTSPATLIIPDPLKTTDKRSKKQQTSCLFNNKESDKKTTHFTPVWKGNPYERMNLWLTDAPGIVLTAGDEVGIFDYTHCVGASVIPESFSKQNPCKIITSMNDGLQAFQKNGFVNSNLIRVRIWKKLNDKEIDFVIPVLYSISNERIVENRFQDKEDYFIKLIDPAAYLIFAMQTLSGIENTEEISSLINHKVDIKDLLYIFQRMVDLNTCRITRW